ncbi:GPI-anchored wall transfer protein 1 [Saitoella complicata NRRL Y-17804]|uniref:GPI-anchored wall transfer protein n=1 Tax=Saitoella complicata (strain BCRC 22490 / CBS 7301 / JCM 7358 / NBRC 10748 / NRRL Y-17804) TaxID=698492 RepID=A0A0E9N9S4_SAICN|nr:GPI-anchored wall transfer protein 1 [Saitoella complicata NRRL Y-17804]ODQ56573.1 GPI-anchored wall transfer protein 1 [Saitoella complicata NRRL Y-17804]GAO46451.1 hypothetical protein G7K_0682-t1 [Saitoella complicata NRRL Y-17804]
MEASAQQTHKALKEAFVSDLSGGDIWEINQVTFTAVSAYALWAALDSRKGVFKNYGVSEFFLEFGINCLGLLLAITLYADNPIALNLALLIPAAILLLTTPDESPRKSKSAKPAATKTQSAENAKRKPFLTAYRGGMMLITTLAILAVDFPLFPRRFAKVETWGTSLMDMGVGSFVFSSGLVSSLPSGSLSVRLRKALRVAGPMLILGGIRCAVTKAIGYQEHVTEYGVHWNFFMTLGFLPPFLAILAPPISVLTPTVSAILIGVVYEYALDKMKLSAWVLTAPRVDVLSQNKEGICSFIGYFAIFLAGLGTGNQIRPRSTATPVQSSRAKLLRTLAFSCVAWSAATYFAIAPRSLYGLDLQVSRRMANLPYILWVLAYNTFFLLFYLGVECLFFTSTPSTASRSYAVPRVLHAINLNGLAIFLLANLLTGLVNMSFNTLEMGRVQSFGVLAGYCGVLATIAILLDARGIRIKL